MGYCYYIVNEQRFDAFDMDKHWSGFPDTPASFKSKADLLDALVSSQALGANKSASGDSQNLAQWFLVVRDRIWRWIDGTPADKIHFVGEDGYYEWPKGCPPVVADVFGSRQGK